MPVADTAKSARCRLFFAIPIDDAVRGALADGSSRLEKAAHFLPTSIVWVPPHNFHLTVHFLGETDPLVARRLARELPALTRELRPFSLDVRKLGYFPDEKNPRVLWAGIHKPAAELKHLHAALADWLGAQGLAPKHEDFHAHITLARFKNLKGTAGFVRNAQQLRNASFGVCEVRHVDLMKSALGGPEPVYETIARGELTAP